MLVHRLYIIAFALTFYCLGTTYFEAFVNYRTWAFIGSAEFPGYHRALTPRVAIVMLVPIAIYVACLIALLLQDRETGTPPPPLGFTLLLGDPSGIRTGRQAFTETSGVARPCSTS